MSSKLAGPSRFMAVLAFRIEGIGMSFGASPSDGWVVLEMDGSVPATMYNKSVEKEKRCVDQMGLAHIFNANWTLSLHGDLDLLPWRY